MRTTSGDVVCTVVEVKMCSLVPEDSEVRVVVGVVLLLVEVTISTVLEGTDEINHSVVSLSTIWQRVLGIRYRE